MKKILRGIILFFIVITITGCVQDKEYTITFESNGGSDIESIILLNEDTFLEPTNPTKEGHTFDGWYTEDTFETEYNFTDLLEGSLVLYASWTPLNFTITYDVEGEVYETVSADYDTVLTEPTEPIKEQYNFTGWYIDEELTTPYSFSTLVTQDLSLYAKFEVDVTDLFSAIFNMALLDNYKMTMNLYLLDYNLDITTESSIDGNHILTEVLGMSIKQVIIDNQPYSITEVLGIPVLVLDNEIAMDDTYTDYDFLIDADFIIEGDYYVIDSDIPELEEVTSYKIKINNGYVEEMILEMTIDDGSAIATITFSDIDNVVLDDFEYLSLEESNELIDLVEATQITDIDVYETSFFLSKMRHLEIDCSFESELCHIMSNNFEPFMYHLGYQTVVDIDYGLDTYIPYSEYVDLEQNEYKIIEIFELANLIYTYYLPEISSTN